MRIFWIIIVSSVLGGCASNVVYNPMQVANSQELLLNDSGFKAVQNGMSASQVHQIMGQTLVIGYQYQAPDYKPLTLSNPYRSENIKGTDYVVEYYLQSINQPDGVVHDDQLMPLVFKNSILVGRGWPLVHSLPAAAPSA